MDFFLPAHHVWEHIRAALLSSDEEVHLKNIGLLSDSKLFVRTAGGRLTVDYISTRYMLEHPNACDEGIEKAKRADQEVDFDVEIFPFTQAGAELAAIAGGIPDPRFISLWKKKSGLKNKFVLKSRRPDRKK